VTHGNHIRPEQDCPVQDCAGSRAAIIASAMNFPYRSSGQPRRRTSSSTGAGMVGETGGPENVTLTEFCRMLMNILGRSGPVRHVPRPVMGLSALLLLPIRPDLAPGLPTPPSGCCSASTRPSETTAIRRPGVTGHRNAAAVPPVDLA
jgi:hypothetical protein